MGQINRIDIVNSPPNKVTGGTYRMAFVHFDYWYSTMESMEVRQIIASGFENKEDFRLGFDGVVVTINTRPVPKTDYNVDQLSDMFHRLREEFTTTIQKQSDEITELRSEVELLRASQAINMNSISEKIEVFNHNLKNDIDARMSRTEDLVLEQENQLYEKANLCWINDILDDIVPSMRALERNQMEANEQIQQICDDNVWKGFQMPLVEQEDDRLSMLENDFYRFRGSVVDRENMVHEMNMKIQLMERDLSKVLDEVYIGRFNLSNEFIM
jgi:exonuclease VII large subunit